jgi:hypothetical protein
MPGATIVPKAINVHDGSGARFPTDPIPHNIVEMDDDGKETVHQLSQAGLQQIMRRKEEAGDRPMNYEDAVQVSGPTQKSANEGLPLLDHDIGKDTKQFVALDPNAPAPQQPQVEVNDDASAPSTEEAMPMEQLDEARKRINPPPQPVPTPESVLLPHVPPRPPTPPVAPPEPEEPPQVTSQPPMSPKSEPAHQAPVTADGKLAPNVEVQEKPNNLDLEPDPDLGPKRLTSYAVPLRQTTEEAPPEPLIKPAMMPNDMREAPPPPEFEKEGVEWQQLDKTSMPTGIVEAMANLNISEMKIARVRIRFRGPFGKLAVPYNIVFRYGIFLVMIQYSPDGSFYEPPGQLEEHIEVQWHGRFFMCLPGPYFIMPDSQTAFTVFMIDEARTLEIQSEQQADGEAK